MNNDHSVRPLVLVIFGITGDLAQRKLLPALYQLAKASDLPEQLHIVGVSRRDVGKGDVYTQLQSFVGGESYDQAIERRLSESTEMYQMDLSSEPAYRELLDHLHSIEAAYSEGVSRLYYLSIPSQASADVVHLLGATGHGKPLNHGDTPRLLVEKPFGYDLASARELIRITNEYFDEAQVYRIDHYVAKETVQNMLTFRFQNPLFESIWDNRHIDHITISAHEQIDIEGRVTFYEQTGALRDFIQNHLLQLLALTTMQRPAQMESSDIHAAKLALLSNITPVPAEKAVRGQYDGYRNEVGNPASTIETYARLEVRIDSDQWRDVPVVLETGKALDTKRTEIAVCFRQPDSIDSLSSEKNRLVFRIQPREGITLRLQTKRPGIDNVTEAAEMEFDYARSFTQRPAEAYERVIVDAIRGDQTLFATAAEVIRSWEIIENVLAGWLRDGDGLRQYAKGSTGPVDKSSAA